jgi:hypothetical protein
VFVETARRERRREKREKTKREELGLLLPQNAKRINKSQQATHT